jgi:hypothetical protein
MTPMLIAAQPAQKYGALSPMIEVDARETVAVISAPYPRGDATAIAPVTIRSMETQSCRPFRH